MLFAKIYQKPIFTASFILILIALVVAILPVGTEARNNASPNFSPALEMNEIKETKVSPLNSAILSPARALSNGKPTLFFFYPVDVCRMRYCRQPYEVAGKLETHYDDRVNFVAVAMNTITYGADSSALPDYPLTTWDVYPVEPYAEWLPEAMVTASDYDQHQAVVVLANSHGEAVYQTGEFFQWDELTPHLEDVLAEN